MPEDEGGSPEGKQSDPPDAPAVKSPVRVEDFRRMVRERLLSQGREPIEQAADKDRDRVGPGDEATGDVQEASRNEAADTEDHRKRRLQNDSLDQNIKHRSIFGFCTFAMVAAWLIATHVWLCLAGLGWLEISDTVLVTLLSTTTATVVGLLWLVLAYLFPGNGKAPGPPAP